MRGMIKRNILCYFRDKGSVFFSLLAVIIVIGLSALFLGDNLKSSFSEYPGVDFLMDSWIMAGIIVVTSLTTTMGVLGKMVEDRTHKISNDFLSSPLRRSSMAGSYILSAVFVGSIMSLLAVVLSEVYIVLNGGELLTFEAAAKVIGLTLLSVVVSGAMSVFMTSLFRSQNAFAAASTIVGTLIGFITGIYMPIGVLPEGVQWIVRLFPLSHAASLMREAMMEVPMAATFSGAPESVVLEFKELLGVSYQFGGEVCPAWVSLLILVGAAVVFYGASVLLLFKKRK